MKTIKKLKEKDIKRIWNKINSEYKLNTYFLKNTNTINDKAFIPILIHMAAVKKLSFDEFIAVLYLFGYELDN